MRGEDKVISLRNIEHSDIHNLFTWRNDPDVRKNFFNSNPVSWNDHEKWFKEKYHDPDTTIYMAFNGEDSVGAIRFETRGQAIQCSIMVNPDFIGSGLGAKIIGSGSRKFVAERKPGKAIIAEIKVDNKSSLKAFRKAGFRESYITCIFDPEDSCVPTTENHPKEIKE